MDVYGSMFFTRTDQFKNHDCMLRNRVVYNIFKVTEIHNLHKFGAVLVKQCKVGGVLNVPEPRFRVGE